MVQKRRKPETRWSSRLFLGAAIRFAVPDKIFGLTLFLDFIDRCHSLCSLTPPPAAVASLPILDNRTAAHKCINIEPTKQSPNRPLIDPYFCSILYRLQESPKAV